MKIKKRKRKKRLIWESNSLSKFSLRNHLLRNRENKNLNGMLMPYIMLYNVPWNTQINTITIIVDNYMVGAQKVNQMLWHEED